MATFLYFASFIFQGLAFWFALISFDRAGQHRYGWLFFSLALLLMLGRRVSPVMVIWQNSQVNITDAALSVPISFLLMLGVLSLRKVLGELDDKTRALLHSQNLDVLTSALNRAALFAEGEKEIERSLRMRHSFAVLMLDIDHFKDINDRCGHQRGDLVLQSLTTICHKILRKIDVFARYGGEEFVAILPGASAVDAQGVAERLRQNVSNHLGFASGLEDRTITVSIGVAVFEPNGNAAEGRAELFKALVERADIAMYHAKNAGRDQVSVFEFSAIV